MEAGHLDELIRLEDSYWWHIAKRRLVIEALTQHVPPPGLVVEGGIGSARNLLAFKERGYDVAGLDIMDEAICHARQRGIDQVAQHDLAEPWPIAAKSARAVVLLDVIEHIADPVAVLRHAGETLSDDGVVVVTVPAYDWLFGDWDKALGHHRRYTRAMFRKQATAAGLTLKRLTSWNSFSLPAAIGVRAYQRLVPRDRSAVFPEVSSRTNELLLRMADLERRCMNQLSVPVGLSLLGVLVK